MQALIRVVSVIVHTYVFVEAPKRKVLQLLWHARLSWRPDTRQQSGITEKAAPGLQLMVAQAAIAQSGGSR